jgi:hypothetical protein
MDSQVLSIWDGIIQRPCKTNVCQPNVQRRESWAPKIPSEKPIKLQVFKRQARETRVERVYLVWPIFRTLFYFSRGTEYRRKT